MPERVTDYRAAGEKMQMVIDYCARHAVVPRQANNPDLPEPWEGVSTEAVQEGVRQAFGRDISTGQGTYTWQRLGADHDVDAALALLEGRREELLDAGLRVLVAWDDLPTIDG